MMKCLLIGSPNSGKTTLFNSITGLNKKVGNWSGVTVEQQHGFCKISSLKVNVVDLPGCYSLINTNNTAADEKLTGEYLLSNLDSIIINVVSATQLKRDLYLTQQLLERGLSVIVAVTGIDLINKQNITIDKNKMMQHLECPVVLINNTKCRAECVGELLDKVYNSISAKTLAINNKHHGYPHDIKNSQSAESHYGIKKTQLEALALLPEYIQTELLKITTDLQSTYTNRISSCDAAPAQESSGAYSVGCERRTKLATKSRLERRWVSAGLILQAMEGDCLLRAIIDNPEISKQPAEEIDVAVAGWRHNKNAIILRESIVKQRLFASDTSAKHKQTTCCQLYEDKHSHDMKGKMDKISSVLDLVALHKILGVPFFVVTMYVVFAVAMNIGATLQPLVDTVSQVIFMDIPSNFLSTSGIAPWLRVMLVEGVGRGINITLTFVPVLGSMFLLLSWLEQSGYITRAAFVVDRLMQAVGLPGKALVSMVIGFGCNVPAIMSARNIDSPQDRILTILMTPFMSCSARLGIYAVFAATFFANNAHDVIFSLYMIGILVAILTGIIWRGAIISTTSTASMLEFAAYRWPSINLIWRQTRIKIKHFVIKAGAVIIPLCVFIGAANELKIPKISKANIAVGTIKKEAAEYASSKQQQKELSAAVVVVDEHTSTTPLQLIGKWITPAFAPMGIESDNWPASVGLLTGMLAKEVVIGTLDTLYTQHAMGSNANTNAKQLAIMERMTAAWKQAWSDIKQLYTTVLHNPLLSTIEIETSNSVLGIMHTKFNNSAAAFSYLLFVLLYCPCISVIATIARETNWRWALFSVIWSTMLAYTVAVVFYQGATFSLHRLSSAVWISGLVLVFAAVIVGLRYSMRSKLMAHIDVHSSGRFGPRIPLEVTI